MLLEVENKDETGSKAIYSYCNQKLTGLYSTTTSWVYVQSSSMTFDSWTSASGADGARGTAGGRLRNSHPPGKQQAAWGIVGTAKSVTGEIEIHPRAHTHTTTSTFLHYLNSCSVSGIEGI